MRQRGRRLATLLFVAFGILKAVAQVGEYRTDLAIGVNGGVAMNKIAFVPEVPQNMLLGPTIGLSARYTCEKYFNSICAVTAELNLSQLGWQENILDRDDQPIPLVGDASQTLSYKRKMTYVQVPVLARLGWGRERRGFQAFFQVGPQFGLFLSEKTDANFSADDLPLYAGQRVSNVTAQDTMAVENKLDYGIAAGAGLEFSHPRLGHFLLEGRYYYGLGNIYGSSKRDYFGRSNHNTVIVKLTYLFDVIRTKNSKIK